MKTTLGADFLIVHKNVTARSRPVRPTGRRIFISCTTEENQGNKGWEQVACDS